VCNTHPAHHPLSCSSCHESFVVDETLILQFYACDDDVHWYLEELYRARLVQFFLKEGLSPSEAEKCQMDVFTRIRKTKYPPPGRNPKRFDPSHQSGATFKAWVFAIAANRLRDATNRQVPFSELGTEGPEGDMPPLEPSIDARHQSPGGNPSPEDEAIAREHRATVRDCLQGLNPRQQLAINVWLANEGERGTNNLLAQALQAQFPGQGSSPATASALLEAARTRMKECLESKGVNVSWSW
jgi:hypothetical protein